MLIDTHCHLTYPDLRPQLPDLLKRAREAGVGRMITVATDPNDARDGLQLLSENDVLFMAAGVHPHEAGKVTDDDLAALRDLHTGKWDAPGVDLARRLVAVGETGLDFHYDFATPERQEAVFRFQIELARQVGRPIIIHAREAEERVCDILAEYDGLAGRVVFHCYSKGVEIARRILDLGLWVSFTGVVTFKNAEMIREAATYVPADRFMVETDAPYLTPEPHRKVRPNEPAYVAYTAQRLAALRGVTVAELTRQTTANAVRFFNLPEETAGS